MGFVNIQNTNFENGVTNRNAADLFGSMEQLDPTKYNTFMDDFNAPEASALTLVGYLDIATGSVVAVDSDGGAISLTTGAAAGNAAITTPASRGFTCDASRPVYFRTKLALGDVANTILVAGLALDILGVTPDEGAFFQKLDTVDTVDFVIRTGAAQTAIDTGIATMVDDEDMTFEFYWDGIDRFYYGINGTPLGFLEQTGGLADVVGATVGPISGAGAGAKDCGVDYLFAAQLRG